MTNCKYCDRIGTAAEITEHEKLHFDAQGKPILKSGGLALPPVTAEMQKDADMAALKARVEALESKLAVK